MGGRPSVGQHLFQTGIVSIDPQEQFTEKRVIGAHHISQISATN